jgi:hypothetical protein
MASLLFNCPTTHQQAPTGIETDVQKPSSRLEGHALTHDCGPCYGAADTHRGKQTAYGGSIPVNASWLTKLRILASKTNSCSRS